MSPTLRKLVPSNLRLRLLALGLALLTYGTVYLESEHEQVLTIPLVVANIPVDRIPIESLPTDVRVRTVAEGRVLARIFLAGVERDALYAVARVPTGAEKVEIDLGPADVVVPLGLGLRIVEVVSPTHLSFVLEELVHRNLPVTADVSGDLPEGYVLSGITALEPPNVRVSGPRSLVERLDEIRTESVDLADRRNPFSAVAPLVVGARLTAEPSSVQISADVEPTKQIQLAGIGVVFRNRGRLVASSDPPAGSVTLLGPSSRLNDLTALHAEGEATGLTIVLDATGLGPGTHEVSPIVELAGNLRLLAVEPPRFALTLRQR